MSALEFYEMFLHDIIVRFSPLMQSNLVVSGDLQGTKIRKSSLELRTPASAKFYHLTMEEVTNVHRCSPSSSALSMVSINMNKTIFNLVR